MPKNSPIYLKKTGTDISPIVANDAIGFQRVKPEINVETLAATKTLVVTDFIAQWLDPDGSDRDVVLPAEASSTNLLFIILNDADGAGEDLVVKNDAPATIATLGPGMSGIFSCDGTDWKWESESGVFYDSVNGRVGIGTTTPIKGLHLVGNGTPDLGQARFGISTTEYTEIGHRGNNSSINAVGDGNLDFRHDTVTGMSLSDAKYLGIGLGENPTIDSILQIANDNWFSAKNYAGTAAVNMFKVNVDDETDVGSTLVVGAPIEATEDSGQITGFDMPVSATPAAGTQMSKTDKIDGNNVLTVGAFADSAGGVTGEFVKNHGASMVHKTDAGAADYNPAALTSDYIVTVDTTAAARAATISTEDRDSGSASKPRIFIIKDIAGNAAANNITISLETSGTIDGAANFVISSDNGAAMLMVDGTNGYII